MHADLKIGLLADHPEHLSTVAGWVYAQWGHQIEGSSQTLFEEKFRGHLQRDRIPITLIAFADDQLVGTASIYIHDLDERPDLGPWLAAVYVPPAWRGQGIASRLVAAVEQTAAHLSIERLYLFTPDQQRLYVRLGWEPLFEIQTRGEGVTVMSTAPIKAPSERLSC